MMPESKVPFDTCITICIKQIQRQYPESVLCIFLFSEEALEESYMSYRARQRWIQQVRGGDRSIAEKFGIDPLVARVLINRGITDDEEIRRFLYGTLDDLDDASGLDQAMQAVSMIHSYVSAGRHIRIIGDYDADGIFSVYILYHTLELDGARLSFDVPDRITDGFGMSRRLVEEACSDGVELIITCDNGIAQTEEIALAKSLGMAVIITDHHEPNYKIDEDGRKVFMLPEADFIVDPKKPGCGYPNKDLCGAAVAWKLMYLYEGIYMSGGRAEASMHEGSGSARLPAVTECPVAMENLPFAAAATVTDIMKLRGENRIIVKYGLKLLGKTANTGMRALIRCCGLENRELRTSDIGFVIGPCINASGRLDTARRVIELLLTTDPQRASQEAMRLSELNSQRKAMTEAGREAAFDLIENTGLIDDKVLIVYLKGIHESVAGIIASKVKETYMRPAIVFTDTENPDHLKGSGRSIDAFNMHEELSKISDVFVKFGGHAMAAGATIERARLDELRLRINQGCTLTENDLTQEILIDAAPPFSYLSMDLISALSSIEPFGPGMRNVMLGCSKVRILSMEVLGANRNCVRMLLDDGTGRMNGVYFGDAGQFISYLKEKYPEKDAAKLMLGGENDIRLTLAYRPEVHEFRFERSIQLKIAHFQ